MSITYFVISVLVFWTCLKAEFQFNSCLKPHLLNYCLFASLAERTLIDKVDMLIIHHIGHVMSNFSEKWIGGCSITCRVSLQGRVTWVLVWRLARVAGVLV